MSVSFSCFHTTGCEAYSFMKDGYNMGSLTCAQIWVHTVHTEGGSGANKSAQELTWKDKKPVPHSTPPGDRTQGLRIDFRLSNH